MRLQEPRSHQGFACFWGFNFRPWSVTRLVGDFILERLSKISRSVTAVTPACLSLNLRCFGATSSRVGFANPCPLLEDPGVFGGGFGCCGLAL